jgi:Tol biopolymer transport system component
MGASGRSSTGSRRASRVFGLGAALGLAAALAGCAAGGSGSPPSGGPTTVEQVPHQAEWGIYSLDLTTQETRLVFGSSEEIMGSALRLNPAGDTLAFARKIGGSGDDRYEISAIKTDGSGLAQLTNDAVMDVYPTWSPDGSSVAFLSMRGPTLQVFVIGSDGSNERLLYDPGTGDQAGDPHWVGRTIAFTRSNSIWTMADDGSAAKQVTHPPKAGSWGSAPLPAGDYDPRFSPDGSKIVFERMVDTASANGGYDLFVIGLDGSNETRLTESGWAQGLATYSNAGTEIVWVVAAIEGQGKYRLYAMDADGTNQRDITPAYYPQVFLCHAAAFARDDRTIYFIGQWWQ